MSSFANVLVIGASGMFGSVVQAELISKKKNFSKLGVLSASAAPSDAKKEAYFATLEAEGVEVIKADFSDNEALIKAFTGWDAIISTVGMPLVKTQLPMIDAAVGAGVKRFVPSEFGFDPSIPSNAGEKVYTMKTAVSNKLKDASKANSDFTYTLLSIGSFASFPFTAPAAFGLDFEKSTANIIGDGQVSMSFTSLKDAAAYVVSILLHPEESKNTTIRVEGTEVTWNGIVKLLEKIQGNPYSVTYQSIQDAQAKEAELWSVGNPMAARYALRRIMAQGNGKVSVVQNTLFPEVKPETNLETIITDVLREKVVI